MADAKDIKLVEDGNYFQAFVSPFTDRPPTSFYSSITIPSDSDRGFEDCLDCAVAYLKLSDLNNLIKILSETTTALPDSSLTTESSNAGTPIQPQPIVSQINVDGENNININVLLGAYDLIRISGDTFYSGGGTGGGSGGGTGGLGGIVSTIMWSPGVLRWTFTATEPGYYSAQPVMNSGSPNYSSNFVYLFTGNTVSGFIQAQTQGAILKVNWQQNFVYVPYRQFVLI